MSKQEPAQLSICAGSLTPSLEAPTRSSPLQFRSSDTTPLRPLVGYNSPPALNPPTQVRQSQPHRPSPGSRLLPHLSLCSCHWLDRWQLAAYMGWQPLLSSSSACRPGHLLCERRWQRGLTARVAENMFGCKILLH